MYVRLFLHFIINFFNKNFMKKLFRILMAAAVLLTASCAKEDISSTIGGGEVEVTFTANLAGLGTRAIADGNTVDRVYLAIFDAKADTYLGELTADAGYPVSNGLATIPVVLLKDKEYDLVFWAQKDGTGAYTLDLENRQVKANYGVDHSNNFEAWSNNEARDAFFNISNDWTAGKDNTTFELRRPFAQINVGNSDDDVKFTKQNGSEIKQSAMTVTTKVYDTIELVNGSLTGTEVSAEFVLRDIPAETIQGTVDPTHDATLNASAEYNYLAMNYLLVNDRQLVDLVFNFTDGTTTFERKYYQVPVQRNYRTNILGQIISSPMDFTVEIKPGFNDPDENLDAQTQTFKVSTAEELAAALTTKVEKHIKNLEIILLNDIDLPISSLGQQTGGSGEYKVGTADTDNITIDLNGKKLNITTTYWSALGAKNDNALFTIKNGAMTSTGNSAGTWNAWDLRFSNCDYVFENVAFEKAVALDNAGKSVKMTDVTITDTHNTDTYGLWITAEGQTVTLENCVIDMLPASDGRGIKIDEQYVASPKKVILNVSNTTFKTEEKAAILVKSVAGAEINASNLDITNVAADSVYAVWVDEASAAYYNLVKVTGAQVRLEGSAVVDTQEELNAAIAAGGHIMLAEGEYTFNGTAKDITIIGTGNVANIILNQVNKTPACNGKNVSFENITFKNGTANYKGIQHSGDVSYKNCVIEGQIFLYGTSETFEGCTFKVTGNVYNVWTYGAGNVTFKNCEFNCEGKSLLIYHESAKVYNVTVDTCNFYSTVTKDDKSAIQMHTEYGITGVLKINDTTATGFANINNGLWNELNNQTGVLTNVFEKYVDGVQVYNELALVDGAYTIYSAAGLLKFANEVNVNNNKYSGKTVKLANDIDLDNAAWTPVGQTGATQFQGTFDGNGKTIYNLNIDKTSETGKHYSSGLFGWLNAAKVKNVTVNGATVKGNHNVGVIAGYLETSGCTIENCHVIGAAVECHHANDDACGDKCGGIVGHAGNAGVAVKDCTVADSTVKAGRDAGQVVGAALAVNVTGCSATNVTVSANGECTGANVRNEVIGRLL